MYIVVLVYSFSVKPLFKNIKIKPTKNTDGLYYYVLQLYLYVLVLVLGSETASSKMIVKEPRTDLYYKHV